MEQIDQKPKKKYKYNRIYLSDNADALLSCLSTQVRDHFSGIVNFNKSDLANLIITAHSDKLNRLELNEIQSKGLSDLQRAKWIVLQLEKSKIEGIETSLESLIDKVKLSKRKSGRSLPGRKAVLKLKKNCEDLASN